MLSVKMCFMVIPSFTAGYLAAVSRLLASTEKKRHFLHKFAVWHLRKEIVGLLKPNKTCYKYLPRKTYELSPGIVF